MGMEDRLGQAGLGDIPVVIDPGTDLELVIDPAEVFELGGSHGI